MIHRRGLAKKKGGVGRHITKMVPRIFAPNLRRQRIWVPELKKFVRVRVTARGLKTINKQGAYKALKKAGAIWNRRRGVSQRRALQQLLGFAPGKLKRPECCCGDYVYRRGACRESLCRLRPL